MPVASGSQDWRAKKKGGATLQNTSPDSHAGHVYVVVLVEQMEATNPQEKRAATTTAKSTNKILFTPKHNCEVHGWRML